MSALRDGFKVVVPPICLLSFVLVSPALGQHQEARGTVRCESNGPFTRCPAYGSWRGARLMQQLSQKACIQGKTWGFDRNAIWVIDGCRGVFDAGDPYANAGERVTCAGTGGRTECPADTRYGVTLVRQVSTTRCVQGSTWGTNQNAVWVDRGCRGEFQIGSGAASGETTKRITCGNPAGQQVTCPTNGSATGVRLVRDLSYGRCQEGQSWGHTDSFIWVNRGCRAEFEVTYRGVGGPEPLPGAGVGTRQINCGSFTNQQVTCKTGGYATSVRLRQDMSGGRCRQGRNWGNTDSFIWTNGGCRGAFEVSYRETGGVPPGGTGTRQITCGTVTIQQVTCKTGGYATSVRLRQDLSGGRCRQGQNWGNTDSFIWANGGCRGTFEVSYGGAGGAAPIPPAGTQTRQITCGLYPTSQQVTCKTGGNATSVRLVKDLSGGNCRQSQTWGNTDSFIWTNNACRGQFEVTYGGSTAAPTPATRVISCGDPSGGRVSCNPFGRVASVRLLQDLGGNRCRQGSTWGYTENDIWASQGCYGQFEVSYVATPQPR